MRKSFLLHLDSLCILDEMTSEQAGEFIKAIYHYQITGELPKLDFAIKMAITPFVNQFVRDAERKDKENRETYVYHVLLSKNTDKFVKIGVSFFLDQRYSEFRRLGYEVKEIAIEKFELKSDAELRERQLHEYFSFLRYDPIEKFAGYTECFSLEILNHMAI